MSEINTVLSYIALGLSGFIVFKIITRNVIQPFKYTPFFGYCSDKRNMVTGVYRDSMLPDGSTEELGNIYHEPDTYIYQYNP
jgi:hypothetical protein